MPVPRWGPQADTAPPPPAVLVNQYRVTLTTRGFQNVADAMTDVIRLPGIPDDLEIHILDRAAIVTVTDEQRSNDREITLSAGTSSNTLPRNRLIRARNETAGLTARIQVIARWR